MIRRAWNVSPQILMNKHCVHSRPWVRVCHRKRGIEDFQGSHLPPRSQLRGRWSLPIGGVDIAACVRSTIQDRVELLLQLVHDLSISVSSAYLYKNETFNELRTCRGRVHARPCFVKTSDKDGYTIIESSLFMRNAYTRQVVKDAPFTVATRAFTLGTVALPV